MNLWKSIAGMMEVEITSAFPEKTLQAAAEAGIPIFSAKACQQLRCSFLIHRRDYRDLAELCRKRGDRLEIRTRVGVFWTAKQFAARPILLTGVLLLLS